MRELDDPSINRERFKDILRSAIKQAVDAEQRANDLQMKLDDMTDQYNDAVYDFQTEHERRLTLQKRLESIGLLTQFSNKAQGTLKNSGQVQVAKEIGEDSE